MFLNVIILSFISKFLVEFIKIKIRILLIDFCWVFALITNI
jgi:hypothetical protein